MLALAGALLADPKVVMIDEMSLGLAPIIVEQLLPTVRRDAELLEASYLGDPQAIAEAELEHLWSSPTTKGIHL